MSDYELTPIYPNHQAFVGWCSELQSFFCQVLDLSRKNAEPPVLSVGFSGEIPTVEELAKIARSYAVLPEDTLSRLRQCCEGRRPPPAVVRRRHG